MVRGYDIEEWGKSCEEFWVWMAVRVGKEQRNYMDYGKYDFMAGMGGWSERTEVSRWELIEDYVRKRHLCTSEINEWSYYVILNATSFKINLLLRRNEIFSSGQAPP